MPTKTTNKGRRFPVEALTANEVKALLGGCSNRAPTGIRNRALIAVLWRCGLRISEALSLRPKDIDAQGGTVRVLHGKGNRARTVGIDEATLALLHRWLDTRYARGINGHRPVFCTLAGAPLKTAYVRVLLPRLARKAKVEKRVHAHGLRHTHAAELAAEGTPLNVIQVALGHSNAATTSRYLAHIAPQQVIDAMRSRSWQM